jgi:hypothetical protein
MPRPAAVAIAGRRRYTDGHTVESDREAAVNTCERCGADAVDARGICQNCGWQRRGNGFTETVGTPSLGETRAADAPPTAAAQGSYSQPDGRSPRSFASGQGGGAWSGSSAGDTPASASSGTSRYCGACGARIEPGQAFCGQCGTPVRSESGALIPEPASPSPSRYRIGNDLGWMPEDLNAPTEQIPDMPAPVGGYGPSGVRIQPGLPYQGPPYSRSGYGATVDQQIGAPDSSRTLRMILGVLCLVGSLISAVAAIVLALATIH